MPSELEPTHPDTTYVNPVTGEVEEHDQMWDLSQGLDMAEVDESVIVQELPSAMQVAWALGEARRRLGRAPRALEQRRRALKAAEKEYRLAYGLAYIRAEGGSDSRRRQAALTDQRVIDAQDAVDEAQILLSAADDLRRALHHDVDLLRSINANVREESKH